MRNALFETRPLAGAIGAEIHGVDLSANLSDGMVAALRQALLDRLVIFFRDQDLPPDRFLALAKRFGTPNEYPFVKGLDGYPEVIAVTKLPDETVNFGGVWHSDTTYLQEPPMATLLVAREVPPVGGDTLFANQYLAYESLSERMQQLLSGLRGVSSSTKADASRTREDRIRTDGTAEPRKVLIAEHPVVRTHPETGRKALYVNVAHTVGFAGMTEEESAAAAVVPVPSPDPARVHLPLPLGTGIPGDLGQSLRSALRDERLSRPQAGDAPCHAGWRPPSIALTAM